MENMKSLADQLRQELVKPERNNRASAVTVAKQPLIDKKSKAKTPEPEILSALLAYDNSSNKSMVHVRFDAKTVRLMNQFKMATEVDVTKLVAFAVKMLFDANPELKQIIKHFIQNTEL